ncbi:hypothetical protein NOU10_03715 [Ligilactobacillus sp. MP3]|uniref:hypothetical protein n=1 Tax=Ligilactobacillus sp. MP3 TaxID=2965103 RepID=UPI00210CB008|nr:hypothetical protein [Ligilactobacillus sp. MP3]MCQ4116497.1 hypothetical protein [Ligilactobacillus sp. MP3]
MRNYSSSDDLKKIISHDLDELFNIYKAVSGTPLCATKEEWLSKYFNSLSKADPNSDTFRYAFNQKFIDKYEEEHLNIFKIQSNCFQA